MALNQEVITVKISDIAVNKNEIQKSIMQKDNDLMLGYANHHDLLSTIFGLKIMGLNAIASAFAVITTFITSYIWDDAKAIYLLLALISIDATTGILKAIKSKTFSSARLPRILVIMIAYTTMLGIAWNISKVSPFYNFLPAILYGGFVSTLIVSVFENLHELNIISDKMHNIIIEKLDLIHDFIFGKTQPEENSKKKSKK